MEKPPHGGGPMGERKFELRGLPGARLTAASVCLSVEASEGARRMIAQTWARASARGRPRGSFVMDRTFFSRCGARRFEPRRLFLALLAALPVSITEGAPLYFSENFEATTVTGALSVPTGWTSGSNSTPNGVAQNNDLVYDPDTDEYSTPRTYISTVDTNYTSIDFIYEITFTVANGGGGGIAFFGIGSGQQSISFYNEPYDAFYLRQWPTNAGNGQTGWTIATADDPLNPSEHPFANPGSGNGTYRARLLKSGNDLTLGVDVNYGGGPFVADYSVTKSLLTDLSFLNSTNSTLFFGTGSATTTFDNLSITPPAPVPEIDPAGIGSVLALLGAGIGLLERRRGRA